MSRNRFVCALLFVVGMVAQAGSASAVTLTIADYVDDFTGPTPNSGWSYLTNNNGAITNSDNYTVMPWYAPDSYYSSDVGGFPALGNNYTHLNISGGHPGPATTNDAGHPWDRYAIGAYTIQSSDVAGYVTPGAFQLTNSTLNAPGGSISVDVFVRDGLLGTTSQIGATTILPGSTSGNFDRLLGNLSAGDTIYVAIGPNGDHSSDGFNNLDFTIQFDAIAVPPAPEPSSAMLLGLGLVGLANVRRRKANCAVAAV